MHTRYSDGYGSHQDIIEAAQRAGIDVVIVTDHNVWVDGLEGYHRHASGNDEKPVLMLVGEEVHDQARRPQKNHLLIIGADRELATFAHKPGLLIKNAKDSGGITFLAHPIDNAAPAFGEDDLSWVDWKVDGYDGIELWNGMTEFKSLLKSKMHALYYAYNPKQIASGPFPKTLEKWDELLATGRKIVAIGGSDAHAMQAHMGPLKRVLFPYEFHFRSINTHILTREPLSGDVDNDNRLVLDALQHGHAFVGYDLPAPTRGFRFTAHFSGGVAWMGDTVPVEKGITLQIRLPQAADMCLIKDGRIIKNMAKRDTYSHNAKETGVYRAEAYIRYKGKRRGWIFSNPIYVK